ncbi:MAG: pyridoxine 5'-phosphate synthase [Vicingaceae bacterium]
MSRLSVNINKVATLRNARGGNVPNVLQVALDCERFGAEGITVHPRPDERHIKYQDVYDLSKVLQTEFNIEGYPNQRFIEMVLEVKPAQVTLVPDPPGVLTSNAGWDVIGKRDFLRPIIEEFKNAGIRTSIFMETDTEQIKATADTGVDRIELYTGPYAEQYAGNASKAIAPYEKAAAIVDEVGVGVNAGHDLDLNNLKYFRENISGLLEVSIGHALVADALYYGLENTIQLYLRELNWSHKEV